MSKPVRHILSLSGGKDSAALAVYMRDRVPEMEYIFHDSQMELPETYAYLERLEAYLGKPIVKTTAERGFEHWWRIYGKMIPSNNRRWCTRQLKLKPFEAYVGSDTVLNYIGLRADEEREGYISHKSNITPVYPFREDGLVYADIQRILEDSGLGLPKYTEWGRTRSGCYFCFYQQKIEWVRLKEKYPALFEQAKRYEQANDDKYNPFYWSGNESLTELERPERMAAIKQDWERKKARRTPKGATLLQVLGGAEEEDDDDRACLICQL
ncbi:phosphoadenosine phosphosulfate reductase family protein [Cystobacter ferrugineus]|uniref:Phosphoadenosine phosphosulfate reductase n=1 Tax=Cystobacter ferrugineus TaxID=83449 RepID=A0A1L9B472_9BACT|nr:phosphoadenosine phosphosulfate reductase family protein [Cystobacter ferrugineus]OJH37075.1 phosphoadenosine phosphosulfate reductase [Cystobacter ferrugineus]